MNHECDTFQASVEAFKQMLEIWDVALERSLTQESLAVTSISTVLVLLTRSGAISFSDLLGPSMPVRTFSEIEIALVRHTKWLSEKVLEAAGLTDAPML